MFAHIGVSNAVDPIFKRDESTTVNSINEQDKSTNVNPISEKDKSTNVNPISEKDESNAIDPIYEQEESTVNTIRELDETNTVNSLHEQDDTSIVNEEHNSKSNFEDDLTAVYDNFSSASNDDEPLCTLDVTNASINAFKHAVMSKDLSFVYLRLRGIHLKGSKWIVGEDFWIWTFGGITGSVEFLTWPVDFGVLSMGILNLHVGGPLEMHLFNTSGNCSNLEVGSNKTNTDIAVSRALSKLILALVESIPDSSARYFPTYLCFKKRMWIEPEIVYDICRNMFCPVEALEYVCHEVGFDLKSGKVDISIGESIYRYDTLWWAVPMIVTFLLFIVCPIPIMWVASRCSEYFETVGREQEEYMQSDGSYHVTIARTLISPLLALCTRRRSWAIRVARCLVPILSLGFVYLQIVLDYEYFKDIVTICIDKYVPMGFRTMLAGHAKSSDRFLKVFGGPFVACSCYVFVAIILLAVPTSLSAHLETGLFKDRTLSRSTAMSVSMHDVERYGSVIFNKKHGYVKVYSVLIAQLNMVINTKFWKYVLDLQYDKCKQVYTQGSRVKLAIMIPLRILEVLVVGFMYGCPIIGFGVIIFRSYLIWVRQHVSCRMKQIIIVLFEVILVFSLIFFFYMFCSIFIDACCFLSRLCIFTYTGVIVYPSEAYGYLILVLSVLYYFWEYLNNFSLHYERLLDRIIKSCESLDIEDIDNEVVTFRSGWKGIKGKLFYEVVELYDPIRKRVLVSFLWFCMITYILGMLVHLVMQRNELRDLHTIMHVGTTIFLCAFPKLIKSVCASKRKLVKEKGENEEIKLIIKRCLLPNLECNIQEIHLED